MAKDILEFFALHHSYFQCFDAIKVHYDKGQYWVTRLLNLCFARLPFTFVFKEQVKPDKCRLFQVADYASTVRLYETKMEFKKLSKSERAFVDIRYFKKVYLKKLIKKNI